MKLAVTVVLMSGMLAALTFAEDTQIPPSFDEHADWNHRHPETDVDIDMYMRHWKESHIEIGYGGFNVRSILTPGDPMNPPRDGAVLKYIEAYDHAALDASDQTRPTTHDDMQVFFFILQGSGTVEGGGESADIRDGSGIFIPAGLTYQFFNTGDEPLMAVVIAEKINDEPDIGDDFEPLTEMKVGNYRDFTPRAGMHWAHIGRGIVRDMKFYNPIGVAVVAIDSFDIAQPHVHGPGTEEVWFQIKGESLLMFGNRLRRQVPGEAFLIPPNGKVPHSSINHTDEPMMWLYMGNRHDRL